MDENLVLTPEQARTIHLAFELFELMSGGGIYILDCGMVADVTGIIKKAMSLIPEPKLVLGQVEATEGREDVEYPFPVEVLYIDRDKHQVFCYDVGDEDYFWFDEKDVTIFEDK